MLARAVALSRSLPLPSLRARRAPRVALTRPSGAGGRRLAIAGLAVLLLAGGFLWLRDSELVGVREVTVAGVSGPQAVQVRRALEAAGLDQTTLHVDQAALRTAVEHYAIVDDVRADAHFPHELEITVVQHTAVATLDGVPVGTDGELLRGARAAGVPRLSLKGGPLALDARKGQALTALAAAAPPKLRSRIDRLFLGPRGLTARLQDGPAVHFGGSDRLAAKWAAATAVLAAASSQGATHVDVRFPDRPAAGGLEQAAEQEPAAAAAAGTTTAPSAPTTATPQGAPSTTP